MITDPKVGDKYWVAWFDKSVSELSIATSLRISHVTVIDIDEQNTYDDLGPLCVCVVKEDNHICQTAPILCCVNNLYDTPQEALTAFVSYLEQQIPKWKAYVEELKTGGTDTTISHIAYITTHKQQENDYERN